MNTSVSLLIFNRPDVTRRVLERIREAKPPRLFVVADGPRADRPDDAEKCAKTRQTIDEVVDWNCDVLKNYSDVNLGSRNRVSSGLNWIFETVEDAIILEDDCLPHITFFQFCDELLEKYRHDRRIVMISGSNMLYQWKPDLQSYHFSYYGGTWGWASWRRAWEYYDVDMKLWSEPEARSRIRDVLCNEKQYLKRKTVFDRMYSEKKKSVWDHQWSFARLLQSGLSIVPSRNLISNIGFTEDATHTSNYIEGVSELPTYPMEFPLKAPLGLAVDRDYDNRYFKKVFGRKRSLVSRAASKIEKILGGGE